MNTNFNIAHIERNTTIYGPGTRIAIWFQGCTLNCKGCWNTDLQPNTEKMLMDREDLLDLIIKSKSPVTFLGGEPLQQADNLSWLIEKLKSHGTHTMLYTGYELTEISRNIIFSKICNMADILIPGRYIESKRNTKLLWRGSSNQEIISRIPIEIQDETQIEIVLNSDGSITCLGYPDDTIKNHIYQLTQTTDPDQ